MRHRQERLNSLIQEELSKIITRDLEFDGALTTVTKVEVSDDLFNAIIGISVIPSSKSKETLKILSENKGRLKHSLLKKLKIRVVPQLNFDIDRGPEKSAQIEKIIIETNNKNNGAVAK